jgi:GntR family histidine utilization transcriptional repressor
MKPKKSSAASLHQQILTDIEKRIVSGDWPPGFKLPFEVDLAKSYNVSRMTVNKVLTRLADAGLIERHRKTGTFVKQPNAQAAILEIHDIEVEVLSLKQKYAFKLVDRSSRNANEHDLARFGLSKNIDVEEIACTHFAGDAPFCWEHRLINLDVVPKALAVDFTHIPPGQWLRLQVPWTTAQHKIYSIAADADIARRLDIAKGSPCLVVERRTWSDQGPVTVVRFTYPAEKHAVVATFTPASSG